jgi:hypothetical protein
LDAVDNEIRLLAGIRSSADPVVSVYLDTCWRDEHQRERVRLFVDDESRKARTKRPDDAALGRTLDRIADYTKGLVEQAYDEGIDGVALFASESESLFRAVSVQRSFAPQRFSVGVGPDVIPLVRLWAQYPPAAVALVDARGARILETGLGEVVTEGQVVGDVHRRHAMGGWSQKRYQRGIRRQIQQNHRQAAALLEGLLELDPRQLFAIAGPDRVIADFRRELSPRVEERVFWTFANPRERSDREAQVRDDLLQQLFDSLVTHARMRAEHDVDAAVGEALAGGSACVGPKDVVLAANEGRVHRLLMHEDLMAPGFLCQVCGALDIHSPDACDYCGGKLQAVPLAQELARKVLLAQGQVEIVEASPRLASHRGLAALLRSRGASADLGATSTPAP